jgi:hypothetical protein
MDFIIWMCPYSLFACCNSCNNKNVDAQKQMMREELRRQPANRRQQPAENYGEMQQCENCTKTTLYRTQDKSTKFKSCSRCLRVRYWCVLSLLPPQRSSGAASEIAVRANMPANVLRLVHTAVVLRGPWALVVQLQGVSGSALAGAQDPVRATQRVADWGPTTRCS